jgi:hypothetical protein
MFISAVWVTLLAAAALWELYCSVVDRRWVSLARIGGAVGQSVAGRLSLLTLWAFVGWHLFARRG